jgi:hypothetical protein
LLRRSISTALVLWAFAEGCLLRSAVAVPPAGERGSFIRLISVAPPDETGPRDEATKAEYKLPDKPAVQQPDTDGELIPEESSTIGDPPPSFMPLSSLEDYANESQYDVLPDSESPSEQFFSKVRWLGLRHSSSHGRNAGVGVPFVGTSWLNRPFYLGADLGPVWVKHPPQENITDDIDLFGGLYGGFECDYYWGAELAVQRATPELFNEDDRDAERNDRRMYWTASTLYYPWGDSMFRPYWRCGIGAMEIDFPTDDGRRDESLWAVPIGVGIKYPIRRWLATRAELTDNIGLGNDGIATQHDLSLTFSLEWRFGVHHRSYWPWNPSRHIW